MVNCLTGSDGGGCLKWFVCFHFLPLVLLHTHKRMTEQNVNTHTDTDKLCTCTDIMPLVWALRLDYKQQVIKQICLFTWIPCSLITPIRLKHMHIKVAPIWQSGVNMEKRYSLNGMESIFRHAKYGVTFMTSWGRQISCAERALEEKRAEGWPQSTCDQNDVTCGSQRSVPLSYNAPFTQALEGEDNGFISDFQILQ